MKTVVIILALLVSLPAVAKIKHTKAKTDRSVRVLSSKRNIFYFSIKSELVGGVVEVYNAKNKLMGFEHLTEREMLIDFLSLPPGKYFIKIKKFRKVKTYDFTRFA